MDILFQELILTNIKVLGAINLFIIAVVLIHRAYTAIISEHSARFQEELWPRVESYLKSASTARHIPTIDLRPNERQHVFDVLLSYSEYYDLDLHDIFDINGFTRERIEKLWTRKNAQLLRELAIIKSPQAQDLLFARLAETGGEEAYRVAHALAAINMTETNQKRLIKTMLKAGINVDRSVEILASLDLPAKVLMEALYEQEGPYGEKIMLSALAVSKDLDQSWIVEDVRPYLFHTKDVAIAAIQVLGASDIPYAFDLLHDEYFNNPSWEVRASIARVLAQVEPYYSIPLLITIAADEAWWVQFNAMASLAKMGAAGSEAIREISRDARNPVAASLARQVLDSRPSIPRPRLAPVFQPEVKPRIAPDSNADSTPDSALESAPDNAPDSAPDNAPDSAPDNVPDSAPDNVPDSVPEDMADALPDGNQENPLISEHTARPAEAVAAEDKPADQNDPKHPVNPEGGASSGETLNPEEAEEVQDEQRSK